MATCEKCKNKYYSKECPHCERIAWENQINQNIKYKKQEKFISTKESEEKIKLYKIIRYGIITFIVIIVTGTIGEIIIAQYFIKASEPTIKIMNNIAETTNEMNKELIKTMKQLHFKQEK